MFTTTPTDNDVICGGSRLVKGHAGNNRFERIVQRQLLEYKDASKKQRSDIITNIVEEVHQSSENGFVQRDPKSKLYYVVPDHRAVRPSQRHKRLVIFIIFYVLDSFLLLLSMHFYD
jgi:hypothetical protein